MGEWSPGGSDGGHMLDRSSGGSAQVILQATISPSGQWLIRYDPRCGSAFVNADEAGGAIG